MSKARLLTIGPIAVEPGRHAFSQLPFNNEQFKNAWKICGPSAERNLMHSPLWAVITAAYCEGLAHGIGKMSEHVTAPTPAPGDGWLPIESAPKDGSTILAMLEDCEDTGMVYTIEWRDEMGKEEVKDGKGVGWRHSWDSYLFSGFDAPKYWQPLPPPPEKDTKP